MAERMIKLPDVGEGVAEVEIVELRVKTGDPVREGDVLAAVMTDKATVEIPSPADGRVLWIGPEVGQKAAVGSEFIKLDTGGSIESVRTMPKDPTGSNDRQRPTPISPPERIAPDEDVDVSVAREPARLSSHGVNRPAPGKPADRPIAAPAVRAYARDQGVDLRFVPGSGPASRILREDVDTYIANGGRAQHAAPGRTANTAVEEIKIVGLRRKIAQRLQDTKRRVPHFSYIEEVDVTDLEALRADVNSTKRAGRPHLTVLPFLMRALVMALHDFPRMNARFDDTTDTLYRHGGMHIGIAIQTVNGLLVGVVRHAETRTIWECANEVQRLSDAARAGMVTREDLGGSTITITSLGARGGLASTPVINAPEIAIIGVNKIAIRPVWRGAVFEPRKIMNLSSSFDHRIVDGWDAAEFIQRLRSFLEAPAKIFMET
jgi:2-oxoisovalerate dehydrogenase E2 component (dihydrolipoyl transacylase)